MRHYLGLSNTADDDDVDDAVLDADDDTAADAVDHDADGYAVASCNNTCRSVPTSLGRARC